MLQISCLQSLYVGMSLSVDVFLVRTLSHRFFSCVVWLFQNKEKILKFYANAQVYYVF